MYITRAQAKSGDVLAVVAPHGAMMVQGATPSQAEWLWEAIRSGSTFQQLVEALGFGVRPSRQIPAFAIVRRRASSSRASRGLPRVRQGRKRPGHRNGDPDLERGLH